MPGGGENPRIVELIVNSVKYLIAPVKKTNGYLCLLALVVALAMFGYIVLAFVAPKVDIPPLVAVVIICVSAFILAFKHAPRA